MCYFSIYCNFYRSKVHGEVCMLRFVILKQSLTKLKYLSNSFCIPEISRKLPAFPFSVCCNITFLRTVVCRAYSLLLFFILFSLMEVVSLFNMYKALQTKNVILHHLAPLLQLFKQQRIRQLGLVIKFQKATMPDHKETNSESLNSETE